MSIMVGTGRGARAGVLIKNAEALETFSKVDTLVIDKTGTLTEGRPQLLGVSINAATKSSRRLHLERGEHPLAAAILAAAREKDSLSQTPKISALPGKGVTGIVNGNASPPATPPS